MEAKKKKLQLRKETMAMLDDPQMHGINGGGPTPTIGPPGSPGTTCADTCKDTCRATCVANCTATIQFTCEGTMCATGTFCDPNQTSGKCPTTNRPQCGGAASGPTGVVDDTDSRKCGGNPGTPQPPGGVTC